MKFRPAPLARSLALGGLGLLVALLVGQGAFPPGRPALAVSAQQSDSCPEPNDGFAQACPITPPVKLVGFISSASDLDTYVLRVGNQARLRAVLSGLPSDYDLHLYTASAQLVQESQNDGTTDETIDVAIETPGNYFLFVNSGRGDFSPNQPYTLSVELIGPGGVVAPPSGPAAAPTPTSPPAAPVAPAPVPPTTQLSAVIQSIEGGRAVLQRADGSAIDGIAPGAALQPGDRVAVPAAGSATIALTGGHTATVNRNSALKLVRLEGTGDGGQAIAFEQIGGRGNYNVAPLSGSGTFTVFAKRVQTIARGTRFEVESRDDGMVLVDCVECDPARVLVDGQGLSSGRRLAFAPTGEVFQLKIYEEPPIDEQKREEEEQERKRHEEQQQNPK